MRSPRGMKPLTASHSLDEHSPRFYGLQDRHQIDSGKEEALRFEDSGPRQQYAHALLSSRETGLRLLKDYRLPRNRRACVA
jgi:hypothetical protein